MQFEKELSEKFLTLQIIAATMMASVALYVGLIVFGVVPQNDANMPDFPSDLLSIVAAIGLGAGFLAKKLVFNPDKVGTEENLGTVFGRYFLSILISFAIWDGIAIVGFIIHFIGRETETALTFCGLSMICMVFGWPKKRYLRAAISGRVS